MQGPISITFEDLSLMGWPGCFSVQCPDARLTERVLKARAGQAGRQISVLIDIILAHRAFGQMFASGAGVAVILGVVDKVLSAKEPAVRIVRGLRFGHARKDERMPRNK
jgi:hypothetical protein